MPGVWNKVSWGRRTTKVFFGARAVKLSMCQIIYNRNTGNQQVSMESLFIKETRRHSIYIRNLESLDSRSGYVGLELATVIEE